MKYQTGKSLKQAKHLSSGVTLFCVRQANRIMAVTIMIQTREKIKSVGVALTTYRFGLVGDCKTFHAYSHVCRYTPFF